MSEPKYISKDFLAILEAIPGNHLILLPDPQFTIVAVTDAYLKATFTTRKGILHHGIFEVFPDNPGLALPTGVKNLSASLQAVLQNGSPHSMLPQRYDVFDQHSGAFRYKVWQPLNTPVFDAQGDLQFIIHTVEDITLQEETGLQLKEEHRRLNDAQAIGAIGSFEWNLGDEAVSWSDEMYRLNGMQPQSEVITINRTTGFIHPDDSSRLFGLKEKSFVSAGHYELQHRIKLDDGTLKWVAHRFESLADKTGKITRVHGTVQDITDLKKTEEELLRTKDELAQRATDKYITLFNSIDEGFVLGRAIRRDDDRIDFLYEDVNPAYERITGIAKEQLVGHTARSALPHLKEDWYNNVEKAGFGQQSLYLEEFAAPSDKWLDTRFSPFGAAQEGRIAIVFSDITVRKKTEQRQKFLLALSDAIRPLADPDAIHETVTQTAMNFFMADRCYYCEIEGEAAIIRRDAFRGNLSSVAGVYPLSSYPLLRAAVDSGHPFVVPDVYSSTIIDEGLRQLCIQLQVISFANVPIVRGGKPVGVLCLVQSLPRHWTDLEVELTVETAERTWVAVESAKAKEALLQSEEKYRTLFNSIEEGFCLAEVLYNEAGKPVDHIMLEANPAFEKHTGLKSPIGKRATELMPGIELFWSELYASAIASNEPSFSEQYSETFGRWFEVEISPVAKGGGKHVAVIFRDITERKKVAQALSESEDTFRSYVTASFDIVYKMSAHWKTMYSLEGKNFLRNTTDVNASWMDNYIPESENGRVQEAIQKAIAAKSSFALEHQVLDVNGKLSWVASRAVPRLNEKEEIIEWIGTATNITVRKEAEEALRRSEEKYRSLFNSIDEGFCVIEVIFDAENQCIDWRYKNANAVFEKQTGFQNPLGKTISELLPGVDAVWKERYGRVAITGTPIRVADFVKPIEKWFDVYAFRIDSPEDCNVAVLFKDITEQKNAEERQLFQLKLNDALRSVADPVQIQAVSVNLLGQHLNANQVHYGETIGEHVHIYQGYGCGLPPMIGQFRYQDFGDRMIKGYRAGVMQVCNDTTTDTTISEAERAVLASARIGAYIAMPLLKEGEWVATLAVHSIEQRGWKQSEIKLVEEIAERTWAAVERAKAEEALKRSEENYRHQLEKEVALRVHELKESRELLQTAFDTTVTGLAVFDAVRDNEKNIVDFEFRFLNKEAVRYYGSDVKGRRYAELHPGIKQTDVFEHYVKTVEESEPQDFEVNYQIEGYDNWFRIITVKLGDGILMSYEDITARKKAESERHKHLTLLHQSEALASIGSWEYDIVTGKFTWSEGMYSLFELDPEREVTPEIYLQLAIDEHKHIAAQLVKGIKGELVPLDETLHLRINGRERILKIKTTVIKDKEGRPVRSLGVDMDITATKKAETQLREQAHFIQSINEAIPDISYVMDLDTKKIIYINHTFEGKLGFTQEQAKAKEPFYGIMHEEDKPLMLAHVEGMKEAADGEVREIEYRLKHADGTLHWFADRNAVFRRDIHGQPIEKIGIAQDITERKKAEQKLKESNISLQYANENLQQFASIASHDLQEPLRKIKMFTSILGQKWSDVLSDEGREVMGKIISSSDRMAQLIKEVLEYSKIAYGSRTFTKTDLHGVIENVLKDVDLLVEESGAVINYPEALPKIDAIPLQMHQVFYNLLTNALKFKKDKQQPVISLAATALSPKETGMYPELIAGTAYVDITVSDNGIGFDPQFSEQIFQIFERLHTVDEFEGTGVGLALCKKIVENHRGHIFAHSKEGYGASFHIILPVAQ